MLPSPEADLEVGVIKAGEKSGVCHAACEVLIASHAAALAGAEEKGAKCSAVVIAHYMASNRVARYHICQELGVV